MGKMDKATDTAPYMRLSSKIDEIKADPRYAFMFSGMLVAESMADFLARIFRLPGDGKPISIIDVSGVPSEITSVVVAMLSRMVFDFAIWSRNEPQRPDPVGVRGSASLHSQRAQRRQFFGGPDSRTDRQGRPQIRRVARADHAAPVGSGGRRAVAMRHDHLDAAQQRPRSGVRPRGDAGRRARLPRFDPALRNRECIICGEGVATPIRLLFDSLEESKRPASEDPLFSELWRETGGEEQILERTIKRWRAQGR
jgi:hypothetical protein